MLQLTLMNKPSHCCYQHENLSWIFKLYDFNIHREISIFWGGVTTSEGSWKKISSTTIYFFQLSVDVNYAFKQMQVGQAHAYYYLSLNYGTGTMIYFILV